jgi:hypothetical protein
MKFSESPAFLNELANTPGIFEHIALAGQESIDLSPIWEDCIGIECEDGGFLLHCIEPSLYEVHTLFPAGRHALKQALEAVEIVFCATDCREMVTRVPVNNTAAMALTKRFGWSYRYTIKNGFPGKDGVQDCQHFGMTLWDWVLKSDDLLAAGQKFHAGLDAIGSLSHADDPVHDRFVGYACRCVDYGNKEKAVHEYNKWAILSGYEPVTLEKDGSISFGNVNVREVA